MAHSICDNIVKKSNAFSTTAVAIIVLTILSASLSNVCNQVMAQTGSASSAVAGTQLPRSSPSSHSPLNTIFKQVQSSVVQITSKIPLPTANPSNPQTQNATALGSGFVYDKQGHIITNDHVVGDAKIVDVTFVDGNKYTAKIIGTDIYSDVAVLKIQIQNMTQLQKQPFLKPLVIGNSSKLEVGDQVIAIGNPFGLDNTLTTGIVSAIGRVLPPATEAGGFSIPNIIQTDAPIAPGSSGGPLLNIQGQVVGMNTAGIPPILGGGIAFAIPSTTITRIATTLIEKGDYIHPYLGLKGGTITSDLAQNITGIPTTNFKGIFVDTITKNGPADKAGIHGSTTDQYSKKHAGDIIVAVDSHPVVRIDDMISYIDQHKSVGDNLTLTVYRNGHTLDLKAILTARPSLLPLLPAISSTPPSTQPPLPIPPHP